MFHSYHPCTLRLESDTAYLVSEIVAPFLLTSIFCVIAADERCQNNCLSKMNLRDRVNCTRYAPPGELVLRDG
jgi:hypothetical protein